MSPGRRDNPKFGKLSVDVDKRILNAYRKYCIDAEQQLVEVIEAALAAYMPTLNLEVPPPLTEDDFK